MQLEDIKKMIDERAARGQDLAAIKTQWDRRAATFPTKVSESEKKRLAILEENFSFEGARVLDIGCGTGRHMRYALDQGASFAQGLEISTEMTRLGEAAFVEGGYARERWALKAAPWEAIDLDAEGWRGAFDLVMALNTPATRTTEGIEKILAASREKVFVIGFVQRDDDLYAEVARRLERPFRKMGGEQMWLLASYCFYRGYCPSFRVFQDDWTKEEALQSVAARYGDWLFGGRQTEAEMAQLKALLLSLAAGRGTLEVPMRVKLGVLTLDVRERWG